MATGRAYNALTGAELKTVIMREVERALDNAQINSVGVTYPTASWSWSLTMLQEVGESPKREIVAGHPQAVEEGRLDTALRRAQMISGGSKRFRNDPPGPTEVREEEKLPQPLA